MLGAVDPGDGGAGLVGMGRLAEGQGPPAARLEPAAKRLGEPAQLVVTPDWCLGREDPAIRVGGPVELGFAAAEPIDFLRPPGPHRQLRQLRERLGVARRPLEPLLQGGPLGTRITHPGGQPGPERQ